MAHLGNPTEAARPIYASLASRSWRARVWSRVHAMVGLRWTSGWKSHSVIPWQTSRRQLSPWLIGHAHR